MKLYLCGQKRFGAEVLRLLLDLGHRVAGVCAPAPRPRATPDRLWQAAAGREIPLTPAGTLAAEAIPAGTDLIVAAHSHDYIGARTRAAARLGALGYHPSLLPRHRGRDAVRWTVHLGDPVAGGSVYWLTDGVDTGPLAATGWCFVRPGDTAGELWHRELLPLGLRLLTRALADVARGVLVMEPQDERVATWEPSWERPRLHRPELLRLGTVAGYRVEAAGGAAGNPEPGTRNPEPAFPVSPVSPVVNP